MLKEDKLQCGIYEVEYTDLDIKVPAVVLGDGSINVMELINEKNGFFGVGFGSTEKGEVGRQIFFQGDNVQFEDTDCQFHILSDNPKSLDVIINKLIDVRNKLTEFNKNNEKSI